MAMIAVERLLLIQFAQVEADAAAMDAGEQEACRHGLLLLRARPRVPLLRQHQETQAVDGQASVRWSINQQTNAIYPQTCLQRLQLRLDMVNAALQGNGMTAVGGSCQADPLAAPPPPIEAKPHKETFQQKLDRQRRQRYAEADKAWAYVQANEARFAAHREKQLAERQLMLGDDAIHPVMLAPVSVFIDEFLSAFNAAKEFIEGPSVAQAAAVATSMLPGHLLPDKAVGKAISKTLGKKVDDLPFEPSKRRKKVLRGMQPLKLPCFQPGGRLKRRNNSNPRNMEHHFARQLKRQQDGLNDLTVGEYVENRQRYKDLKRQKSGTTQADFRQGFTEDLKNSLLKSYKKNNIPTQVAEQKARQRTQEIMKDLAALHDPDMVAGGKDQVKRMGHKGVNASLGAQWKQPDRLAILDSQAKAILETLGPDVKMNVSLSRCPLKNKK